MTTVDSDSSGTNIVLRGYKFRESVKTDIGLRRNENQDAYGIAHTSATSFFVVADGMGGARGGATASAMAINVIINEAIKQNGIITRPSLKHAIEKANEAIYSRSKANENLQGMGTTVVALAFVNECAIIAHVGDSRIYRLRNEELTQLTRDHTLVQELVDSGALPPEEAENHPIAHMLTRSLGPAPEVEVDIQALVDPTQVGDKFLLCSDGLYNLVTDEEISQHLLEETPDVANEKLIALALERGGTDNVTVEILEVCGFDDESLAVEYPPPGELRFVFSEGVAAPEIRSILEQQDSAQLDDLNGDTLKNIPIVEDIAEEDEAVALADIGQDALSDTDVSVETPAIENRSVQLRLQASVFFVVGLTAGIFGFFLYQYSGVKTVGLPTQETATVPKVQPDGELAHDLTALQNRQPNTEISSDLPSTVASTIPSMSSNRVSMRHLEFVAALALPDAPDIQVRDPVIANIKPNRPIVWDNEEQKLQRILNAQSQVLPAVQVDPQPKQPTLLTSQERKEYLREKSLLRDRISDIDSKLQVLGVISRAQSDEIAVSVNKKAQEKSDKIINLRHQVNKIGDEAVIWHSRLDLVRGSSAVRLAEDVSAQYPELKPVFDAYSRASEHYAIASEQWYEEPNNIAFSTEMNVRARENEQAKVALEQSLTKFVTERMKHIDGQVAELKLSEDLLVIRRDQLSRFEGYLRGFTEISATRKKEIRDGYYKQRGSYAERLNELKNQISDSREVKLLLDQYNPDYPQQN